jgi:hypothetical protein
MSQGQDPSFAIKLLIAAITGAVNGIAKVLAERIFGDWLG